MFTDLVKYRFFDKVVKAGNYECWEWKGSTSKNGYGNMNVGKGVVISAHRISYMLEFGDIPDGKVILHICDNKKCVNPNHLRARSSKENAHDMLWKGRGNKNKRKIVLKT